MNRVNAPDGTPLVFDVYEPAQPAAAVLLLRDWQPQPSAADAGWAMAGEQLQAAGLAAYVLDQRGHGRSGGKRGHLSRFSQLLGDLQAFRRVVRRRHEVPQVLGGQGFGALVVLRYLETQPGEPPVGAVLSGPWLAPRVRPAPWKRLAAQLADLWPSLPTGRGSGYMTAGARAELLWAQRAVLADYQRIDRQLLFLLGGADRDIDPAVSRDFAGRLGPGAQLQWYPELGHDLFNVQHVIDDLRAFVARCRSSEHDPKI
ncbi:MAG: alpha/beta fold hydrolase [Gemmatimonadales bacterium]